MMDRDIFILLYALNDQLCEHKFCYRLFFYKAMRLLKMEYAVGYKLTRNKRDPDVPCCSRFLKNNANCKFQANGFKMRTAAPRINGREIGANIRALITILNYRSDCLYAGAILFNVVRLRTAWLIRLTYRLSSYLVSTVPCVNMAVDIKFIVRTVSG